MIKMMIDGHIEWELVAGGLLLGSVIGAWMAIKVEMTGMPELVALFNGLGGAASALVALAEVLARIKEGDVPTDRLNLWAIWIAIGLS